MLQKNSVRVLYLGVSQLLVDVSIKILSAEFGQDGLNNVTEIYLKIYKQRKLFN